MSGNQLGRFANHLIDCPQVELLLMDHLWNQLVTQQTQIQDNQLVQSSLILPNQNHRNSQDLMIDQNQLNHHLHSPHHYP